MGKVFANMKLTNNEDLIAVKLGVKKIEEVRTMEIEGLVDTGATMLQLPEDVVKQLGLTKYRKVTATYADNRKDKKGVAGGIRIEILGRMAEVECVIEAVGSKALIGQIPLEALDLVVDCNKNKIGPRPESPDMAMIDMY